MEQPLSSGKVARNIAELATSNSNEESYVGNGWTAWFPNVPLINLTPLEQQDPHLSGDQPKP